MKKPLRLISCALLVTLFSCSQDSTDPVDKIPEGPADTRVSVEDAIKAVDDLLDFLDSERTRSGKGRRTISADYYPLGETVATRSGETPEEGEEPLYYLFNFDNDEGFAIVVRTRACRRIFSPLPTAGISTPRRESTTRASGCS